MAERPLGTILLEMMQQHVDQKRDLYSALFDLLREMALRIDDQEGRIMKLENPPPQLMEVPAESRVPR